MLAILVYWEALVIVGFTGSMVIPELRYQLRPSQLIVPNKGTRIVLENTTLASMVEKIAGA